MFRAQLRLRQRSVRFPKSRRCNSSLPIVQLKGATFYRQYPSPSDGEFSNAPILKDVSFTLPNKHQHWAVVSPTAIARTSFLQALDGKYICLPPTARSYPYLLSEDITDARLRNPEQAVKYVGFDAERGGIGGTAVQGAYLSARYEAHREVTDWSVLDYLEGNTELNALEKDKDQVDRELLETVIKDLNLGGLLSMPVSSLSNGQTRRARIAKALLTKPELLLLDGPFMGLDPMTQKTISTLLRDMAEKSAPRLLLSLRPEDRVPDWITHLLYLDSSLKILAQGNNDKVFDYMNDTRSEHPQDTALMEKMRALSKPVTRASRAKVTQEHFTRDAFRPLDRAKPAGEPVVEMQGVKVSYGEENSSARKTVLGDWKQPFNGEEKEGLWWTLRRGERWGVFGPNGSGKTTLLSLITSDHPQTYSLPIKLFGRSRLPAPGEPGISIFQLQSRMGHSSPEVHSYFPKQLSVRRVLESAWADAPLTKPRLTHQADRTVSAFLRWFAPELSPTKTSTLQELGANPNRGSLRRSGELKRRLERMALDTNDIEWADTLTFRDLTFSSQRILLFLRAIVASPDLVILDEAFSGMDEAARDKCLLFLSHGEVLLPTARKSYIGYRFQKTILSTTEQIQFSGLEDRQALVVISHSRQDVPGCVRQWITLPEPATGAPARVGTLKGPLEFSSNGWDKIWKVDRPVLKRRKRVPAAENEVKLEEEEDEEEIGKEVEESEEHDEEEGIEEEHGEEQEEEEEHEEEHEEEREEEHEEEEPEHGLEEEELEEHKEHEKRQGA